MKQTLRLTVVFAVLVSMLACLPIGSFAAVQESEIIVKDNSYVTNTFEYDFSPQDSKLGKPNSSTGMQKISSGLYIEGEKYTDKNAKYLYGDINGRITPGATNVKLPEPSTWTGSTYTGGGLTNGYYSFTHVAGEDNEYGEAFMQIKPANLIQTKEALIDKALNGTELPVAVYDFATLAFSLSLSNLQSVFFVKLANSNTSYLLLVVPVADIKPEDFPEDVPAEFKQDDYVLCLRKATTVGDAFYSKNDDIIIGSFGEDEWVDIRLDMYLQEGTIGYFDYSVFMKKEGEADYTLLSDKGSMYHDSTMIDDASLANTNAKILLSIPAFKETLTENSVVAIDNLKIETSAYVADPSDVDANYPAVEVVPEDAYETVWESTVDANDILNLREDMTIINTEYALQLPGMAGANYRDPASQVKGAYHSADSDYQIVLADDGSVTIMKKGEGNAITLPLYKKSGNINLKGDKIGAAYQISFEYNFSSEAALALSLNGKALNVPSVSLTGWNRVTVTVDGANATVSVAGSAAITESIPTDTNTPAFAILLPDGKAVSVRSFSLTEKTTANKYYVTIGGTKIELNAARAKYLLFLQDTSEDNSAIKHDTLERTGSRPVGTVYFDSDKYYYDTSINASIRTWGTCITNHRCDITYWGTSAKSPDAVTGEETNSLLNGKAYTKIDHNEGAMVIGLNNVGVEHWFTYGFQSNLKKADGLLDMPRDYIDEYFRYSFSIWYDPNTFVGTTDDDETRVFTFSMAEGHQYSADVTKDGDRNEYGDNKLGGQTLFTINYEGTLTIPAPKYAHGIGFNYNDESKTMTGLSEDIEVQLENGWNTISMVFKKLGDTVRTEDVTGVDPETGLVLAPASRELKHTFFDLQYDINGDVIYHNKEDLANGMHFVFDNGLDPTAQGMYFFGNASLYSQGNEKASELERISIRGIKMEACEDKVIDVNCYIKGTAGDEVLKYTDFSGKAGRVDPTVKADGNVTFVNENDKLVVTHKADATLAQIGYFFDTNMLDKHLTFDVSVFADFVGDVADNYDQPMVLPEGGVKLKASTDAGELVLLSIDKEGKIYGASGELLGLCLDRGWNNLSATVEKMEGKTYLTIYVQGEILSFREEIAANSVTAFYVETQGNENQAVKLDNMAVANDYVPTSIVYMMPVVYETNGGALSGGLFEEIHFIGQGNKLFASAGKEAAEFIGWYYDQAFTAKANRVKASYTAPVVLYAKYNYQVSFGGATATVYNYGNIELPRVAGVYYWRDANGTYYAPGATYFVSAATAFTAVSASSAEGTAITDFVVKVNGIDKTANYEDIFAGVFGTDDLKGALELYNALPDAVKTNEDVVAAKQILDELQGILLAKENDAKAYIAQFDIVKDATLDFITRYTKLLEMYNPNDLDENGDLKEQWRHRVDPTYPGIFEVNDQIMNYLRTFERVAEVIVDLSDALYFYANINDADAPWAGEVLTDIQKKYLAANDLYLVLKECFAIDAKLVETYTITADDYAAMKDGTAKTYLEYKAAAESVINGSYNDRFAIYNQEIFDANAAVGSISHKLTDSLAIKVGLDSIGKIIALPVYSRDED